MVVQLRSTVRDIHSRTWPTDLYVLLCLFSNSIFEFNTHDLPEQDVTTTFVKGSAAQVLLFVLAVVILIRPSCMDDTRTKERVQYGSRQTTCA